MPLTLDPGTIALRLALAAVAGLLIGFNRGEYGHAAGLRTTLLVCVAAALAMLQANLLMATPSGIPNHDIRLDLMRLPLGILSGIGFIGAGAIFRRGDLVQGVTTAATLWLVTVLGLCFGGGQIGLGLGGLGIGIVTLWVLKPLEAMLPKCRNGQLELVLDADEPSETEIAAMLRRADMNPRNWSVSRSNTEAQRTLKCDVRYPAKQPADRPAPPIISELARRQHVRSLQWKA